jgi:hypothetical protein
MAYRGKNTKYGNKTTSQITALSGMAVGDTVFNTDYGRVDFYTGSVWTNNNSIIITAGATITEGQICQINASGQAILLNGFPSSNAEFGVGICGYGGTIGQSISLIMCGIAKCRVGAAGVTIGQYATISSTAGSVVSTTSPSIGALGRVLQTQTSGNLAYVMLAFIERA